MRYLVIKYVNDYIISNDLDKLTAEVNRFWNLIKIDSNFRENITQEVIDTSKNFYSDLSHLYYTEHRDELSCYFIEENIEYIELFEKKINMELYKRATLYFSEIRLGAVK